MVAYHGAMHTADATTCLAHALDRYERVETIGFDYTQRHRVELDVRPTVLAALRARGYTRFITSP